MSCILLVLVSMVDLLEYTTELYVKLLTSKDDWVLCVKCQVLEIFIDFCGDHAGYNNYYYNDYNCLHVVLSRVPY